jgi:Kef-type K+ transport system membrane component KefB
LFKLPVRSGATGFSGVTLLLLGMLFLVGLVADVAGRLTPLPRVTLLLLGGLLLGPSGFDLIPEEFVREWFPVLTTVALSVIGFLMGQKLTLARLRTEGREIVLLAMGKVLGAAVLVFMGVWLVTENLPIALILGGVATATAPAATFDVVHELGAKGRFVDRLLGIVVVDDAFGLILFSLLIAVVDTQIGNGADDVAFIAGAMEAFGSIAVGALLGVPMAYLTGRLDFGSRTGEPVQAEAIGFVLISAGATQVMGLSPILAAMAMGSVVASLAQHHARPFHAIEGIEWPFLILFFVLAGASLIVAEATTFVVIAVTYIGARTLGTVAGIWIPARVMRVDRSVRRWLGAALLPQAGVALGMTLLAAQRYPQYGEMLLSIVLSTTIVLELCSPFITRTVLRHLQHSERDKGVSL